MGYGFYDAGNVAIAFYTVIENAVGTAENDILVGNAWDNNLYGGDGNDYIFGDGMAIAENALIDGIMISGTGYLGWEDGSGNVAPSDDESGMDALWGEAGDDWLYGGAGIDLLYGGTEDDHLFGGAGNDILDGGVDDDVLYGGSGDDTIYGGNGSDVIRPGIGNSTIYGDGDFTPYYQQDMDVLDLRAFRGIELDLSNGTYSAQDGSGNFTGIDIFTLTNADDVVLGENDAILDNSEHDTLLVDAGGGYDIFTPRTSLLVTAGGFFTAHGVLGMDFEAFDLTHLDAGIMYDGREEVVITALGHDYINSQGTFLNYSQFDHALSFDLTANTITDGSATDTHTGALVIGTDYGDTVDVSSGGTFWLGRGDDTVEAGNVESHLYYAGGDAANDNKMPESNPVAWAA